MSDITTIELLTNQQWCAISPILTLALFATVALVLTPVKKAGRELPFFTTLLGGLLALGILISQLADPNQEVLGGLMAFDNISRFFSIAILFCFLAITLVSHDFAKREKLLGEIYPLLTYASVGMLIMVSTRDLFMLFIGLELSSLSIYTLVGSQRFSKSSAEASLKYFILGGAASAVFLFGTSLFYGATGTTLMSGFGSLWLNHWQIQQMPLLAEAAILLIVAGFLFKLGGFPLHFWIPDVYTGAPTPVTGFMITGVKAAAVGTMFRFSVEVLGPFKLANPDTGIYWLIAIAVAGSLAFGSLVGLTQTNLKRMLAYSTIVHTGFILLGIFALAAFAQPEATSAVLAYILFYIVMNLGAFAVLSQVSVPGKEDLHLEDLSGLHHRQPFLALALSITLASMAGLPLTGGFLGKYQVLSAALASNQFLLVAIAILASLLSAAFYLKPLAYMYMASTPGAAVTASRPSYSGLLVVAVTALFTLLFGFFPAWALYFQ